MPRIKLEQLSSLTCVTKTSRSLHRETHVGAQCGFRIMGTATIGKRNLCLAMPFYKHTLDVLEKAKEGYPE